MATPDLGQSGLWRREERTKIQIMQGVPAQSVSTQPVALSQMVTTVTQLSANDWSSGVCNCCDDMGICCFAFWCFHCFQCSTTNDFGECLCLPLLELGLMGLNLSCPSISLAMRASLRERYRIPGSICNDCCTICWCYSCTWCQMAREIKKRKQPVSFVTSHMTPVPMVSVQTPTY